MLAHGSFFQNLLIVLSVVSSSDLKATRQQLFKMLLHGESTVLFLQRLLDSQRTDLNSNEDFLFSSLQSALNTDGYALKTLQSLATNQNLRGLEELESPGEPAFNVSIILVLICIICAGLASGLTQGLLSLDYMEMTIKSRSGSPLERKYAKKVRSYFNFQNRICFFNLTLFGFVELFLPWIYSKYRNFLHILLLPRCCQ